MISPKSSQKVFDIVALSRQFRNEVVAKNHRPTKVSWERECRPILIDAAINDLDTRVVLNYLQKHQVPFSEVPKTAERTLQLWLARVRKAIYLPTLPDGAKRSSPGYQEGLRIWKKTNPIPTVEEIIAGWQAKPVNYSNINFFSLVDAYAPRTPKKKKNQATLPTPVEAAVPAETPSRDYHSTSSLSAFLPAPIDSPALQAHPQTRQSIKNSESIEKALIEAGNAITSLDETKMGFVDLAQGPEVFELPSKTLPFKEYQALLMKIFATRARWLEESIESLKNHSVTEREELYCRATEQINSLHLSRAAYSIRHADAVMIYRRNDLNPEDWPVELGKARSAWDSANISSAQDPAKK